MEDELRESHFAALIIGTGLTQSIIAAALAAASYPIIHIDELASYGGPHASLSLTDLTEHNLKSKHELTPELLAKSRQYALSLAPHLIPATGPFIATLVNSGVSRYGSFALLKKVAVATAGSEFRIVPANKQDVFRDRGVSLVQKRRLIKFLMFAVGEFEDSAELGGHEQTPLLEFLRETFGISADLAEALAYAVAFCVSPNDPTLPALIRTRNYLRSTGRYGPSPFLIGHYGGAGELAQGFCRTCAVRGGTYVLGRKVLGITKVDQQEENQPESSSPVFRIQLDGFAAPFTASTLVGPEDALKRLVDQPEIKPPEPEYTNTVRGIIVIDSPTSFTLDRGEQEQEQEGSNEARLDETLLVFSPSCGLGSEGVVTVLVNGAATASCPDGQCVLYFTAQTTSLDVLPEEHLMPYVNAVLDACIPRPEVHLELFYREQKVSPIVVQKADVIERPGQPRYTSMHTTEGADAAAQEAEAAFWKVVRKNPAEEVEFFARVAGDDDEGLDDF